MANKSKLWKVKDGVYKVHVRSGLIQRIELILKDKPAAWYYEKLKLIAVDYNVPLEKRDIVKEFIKKTKLKK